MKRKMLELEWNSFGGHKVVVVTGHDNGLARIGMVTKNGVLWLGRTTMSLVRAATSESTTVIATRRGWKSFDALESDSSSTTKQKQY